jgi:transposase-like protein
MRITDQTVLKQVDKRMIHLLKRKVRVCPKCARFYHIVKKGKSPRKKYAGQGMSKY